MPRQIGQAYDADLARGLQGVVLPPKIKCVRCEKFMNAANFSNKQLNDARYAVKNNARYKIKCMRCTGGTLVELECMMCNEWKGLEEFAKSQRTKPDNAKCYKCIEEQVERAPVNDQVYEDPRNAFTPLDSSAGNYPEYWSNQSAATSEFDDADDNASDGDGGIKLENKFHNMSLGVGSNYGSLIDSSNSYSGQERPSQRYDGRNTAGAQSWHTTSTAESSRAQTSKFDATSEGTTKRGAGSGPAPSDSFSSNFTERSGNIRITSACPSTSAIPQNERKTPFFQASTSVREDDDWHSESEDDADDDDDDDDSDIEL